MKVVINGDSREIPENLNIATLIEHLGMLANRVALERNREIVPRARWKETSVQPNDSFEIVHLVGGGDHLSSPHERKRIYHTKRSDYCAG